MNSFSLGAQIGGRLRKDADAQEQELRDLINRWTGDYSRDIREFAFLLRIDGNIHTYTEMWKILGAQKAKLKRDWIEVEIGIPEIWWRESDTGAYKHRLANEVEKGLISMVNLLESTGRDIKGQELVKDWARIKFDYLASQPQPKSN